jgi:Resolvase, N terminal domain
VVLVDDLSRLARDNHLVLSIIAELHFEGIRMISVADGLDSTDEESTLAIQVRGIFNELSTTSGPESPGRRCRLPCGLGPRRPRPHRRTALHGCGGRFEFFAKVETPGIEPGSAVACKVASTSVAGALISPSDSPRRRGCREPAPKGVPGSAGAGLTGLACYLIPTPRPQANRGRELAWLS